jgi:rare lipoprotein A
MRARRRVRTVLFILAVSATAPVIDVQSASAHKTAFPASSLRDHRHKVAERQALRNHLFANRRPQSQSGIASVYSGGKTASGERMNSGDMTAAHPSLPFGTRVRVTNRHTGRSVVVRINDRGPFIKGRVIDLSPAAARAIGVGGVALVSLRTN